MNHFFTDAALDGAQSAVITGADHNHIRNVLRMKAGEQLVLTGSEGVPYLCELTDCGRGETAVRIIGPEASPELALRITLCQALPKGDKMETVVQKAVELGAARIVPVETARCVVRLDDKKKAARRERWQAIAEAAAKQSGRGVVPEVSPVTGYKQALAEAAGSLILFPYENAEGMAALGGCLQELRSCGRVTVFIGPEGGFEPPEVDAAAAAGARIVSLGRRILRTETAGAALIAFLMLHAEMDEAGITEDDNGV